VLHICDDHKMRFDTLVLVSMGTNGRIVYGRTVTDKRVTFAQVHIHTFLSFVPHRLASYA